MVAAAERFVEEDALLLKTIEPQNASENLIYSLKSQLNSRGRAFFSSEPRLSRRILGSNRMVAAAERFVEDALLQKKIESRNAYENFIYSLQSQLGDQEGLGGKLDSSDKKTIEDELKKGQEWIEEFGASASA
ncbi:uncharacterized protein JCM10292_001101 [Rhodotorula paludigena]|uniref:uncharacterized protein n=1 Tax=Rhodotorula paludigena TaxID=86838 RepID=UPI003176152C